MLSPHAVGSWQAGRQAGSQAGGGWLTADTLGTGRREGSPGITRMRQFGNYFLSSFLSIRV